MNEEAKYPIKYISLRTGFSQLLIRTWENRYDFLKPERTATKRRLYSEKDLQKLIAIKNALDLGFKIGELADMPLEDIRKLYINDTGIRDVLDNIDNDKIMQAVNLIQLYDSFSFSSFLSKELINSGKKEFIRDFIIPLLVKIGDFWEDGTFRVSHEHFASSIIGSILSSMIETQNNRNTQVVITATPTEQNHGLMALAASALISALGYRVIHLGRSVPADDIISTVNKSGAVALVLSIIFPQNDYAVLTDLKKISENLEDTDIYIGGAAAKSYYDKLDSSKFIYVDKIEKVGELIKLSGKHG